MAGFAMAFGGLAVAVFDRKATREGDSEAVPTSLGERARLGCSWPRSGLVVGFESRGGLLGLGVPLLAVGIAWAVAGASGPRGRRDVCGDVVGILSLAGGMTSSRWRPVGSPPRRARTSTSG